MERATEIFATLQFLAIGLSHVLQPRAWAEFFLGLRERGDAGVFVVAFMSLWFGSVVVALHNVWSGIPVVLTVIGWAQLVKGTVYFAAPSFATRRMKMISIERAWVFIPPGIVFLVLAGLLGWNLWRTW
jgi:hypothetical protein